jgi:hypothetical protein
LKWRRASSVLCAKKVVLKLKEKFYQTTVRMTMLYGTKCWALNNQTRESSKFSGDEDVALDEW